MAAVLSLCTEANLLEAGQVVARGDVSNVGSRYMQSVFVKADTPL